MAPISLLFMVGGMVVTTSLWVVNTFMEKEKSQVVLNLNVTSDEMLSDFLAPLMEQISDQETQTDNLINAVVDLPKN